MSELAEIQKLWNSKHMHKFDKIRNIISDYNYEHRTDEDIDINGIVPLDDESSEDSQSSSGAQNANYILCKYYPVDVVLNDKKTEEVFIVRYHRDSDLVDIVLRYNGYAILHDLMQKYPDPPNIADMNEFLNLLFRYIFDNYCVGIEMYDN